MQINTLYQLLAMKLGQSSLLDAASRCSCRPTTVIRPSPSVIAVSDDPGFGGGGKLVFPITYHATFDLFAFDIVMKTILRISYVIDIRKQKFDEASPTITLSNAVKAMY